MAEGERSQPSLPKNIGRYQIQASLGAGAMGAVYKGFDPLIKRTLAIKTIRLDIHRASDEYKMFLERFYQEARISGTLSHPNIVTLFDIGEDNGLPFLALEYIEGETVEALLARGVKFRPEKVVSLISQIAAALDYAHSKGVIHRDIKPANLLLYDEDRVKVTDFGIAKLADVEMTKVGQLLGTPSYMSPEQAMGEKLDGRSDIFSLGVCAFEMLCGKQPFPGNNVTAILYRLVHVEPIEPDNLELNGLIPQKWHEVFPKVLSKKREDRYQTAAEFVRDLEYCLGSWFTGLGEGIAPASDAPPPTVQVPRPPPAPAAPAAAPARPAAPPPAPPAPAPAVMSRNADDPSVVVSMDEIQDAISYPPPTARRPTAPAQPEEEELPATIAVSRPGISEDEEPPPTLPIARPEIPQEKTIVLPPPTAASAAAAAAGPAPATPPAVAKPASNPPYKPSSIPAYKPPSNPPYKPGSVPPYKPLSPLASRSQPPRVPGPGSRAPGPRSVPPNEPLETEEVERPRGGVPKAWIAGGAAALVALLIVVGVMIGRRGKSGGGDGNGTPGDQPAAGSGAIKVETTPSGATIKLNDQSRGKAPTTLTGLAAGTYEVVAELSGHEPAFQNVTLKEGDPSAAVSLSLQPSKSATSAADILSRPPGAIITMDGQKIGQTPMRGHKLRVGNRRFRLTTEGYEPFVEFLKVEEGRTARLDARLVPLGTSPAPTSAPSASTVAPSAKPSPGAGSLYMENEVDTPPKKLSGADYQPKLKSGEALSVTLSWVVNEKGDVIDVEVVESGGKSVDEPVMQAIRKWRFAPAVKQGVKVKVQMARRYTFKAG